VYYKCVNVKYVIYSYQIIIFNIEKCDNIYINSKVNHNNCVKLFWSQVYFVIELVTDVIDVLNLNTKNESQRRRSKKQNDGLCRLSINSITHYKFILS